MNSRDKGKRGELEWAHYLYEKGYTEAKRTAQRCGKGGTADVDGVEGLHCEVKRRENGNVEPWLQQAERDASGTGNIPIVAHRRNREEWKVTLRPDDFFEIYEGYRKWINSTQ